MGVRFESRLTAGHACQSTEKFANTIWKIAVGVSRRALIWRCERTAIRGEPWGKRVGRWPGEETCGQFLMERGAILGKHELAIVTYLRPASSAMPTASGRGRPWRTL